ncbi:MAG: hypothetical protein M3R01_07090, partial [Actinomycetota bacterium]|nr:hypothetical protein [Actinomycetota bacterium]
MASLGRASTTRLLLLLLAPFVVATIVGLIALWPGTSRSGPSREIGAPDDLVDAEIVELQRGRCQDTPSDTGLRCIRPVVRLLEGPDEGERIELLEQPEGEGSPSLAEGETIILSYEADAEEAFRYAFSDRERRTPLYLLAG